jgi:hypothetical protein
MPGVGKIIAKMKNQPHGVQFFEAERVLAAYGSAYIETILDIIEETKP